MERKEKNKPVNLGLSHNTNLFLRLLSNLLPYKNYCLGALLLIPLASLLNIMGPRIIQYAIDELILKGKVTLLPLAALAYIFTVVLLWILTYGYSYLMQWSGQKVLFDLRMKVFTKIMQLPSSYFDYTPVGRTLTRATNDIENLGELVSTGAITMLADFITLLAIMAAMFWLDSRLALVAVAVLPLLVLFVEMMRRKAMKAFRRVREKLAQINAYLQENLSGIKVVKSFGAEKMVLKDFNRISKEYRNANFLAVTLDAILYAVVEMAGTCTIVIIIAFGVSYSESNIKLGVLVAFIEYARRFFRPVIDLSSKFTIFQSSLASGEKIFALLDREDGQPIKVKSPLKGNQEKEFHTLEFSQVYLSYGEQPVLKDISFKVEKGEKIALVGPTGSGKTSIIKALLGFYPIQSGQILINGRPQELWDLQELRFLFSVVQQEVSLFNGSARENLSLFDSNMDEKKLRRALANTHCRFALGSYGLDKNLIGQGCNLSYGERQLLAFARCLAFDRPVLLLDEATSSIDSGTEKLVTDALEKTLAGKTALMVAHRLSTIKRADRILVIANGGLVQEGKHETLLTQEGIYRDFWQLQELGFRARSDSPKDIYSLS